MPVIHLLTFSTNNLVGLNESLTKINGSLNTFGDFLFFLLAIIAYLFLIFMLLHFIIWLRKDQGMFIQPFIVGCCDDNYNGNAISDLLTAELIRIRNIHMAAGAAKSEVTGLSKAKADMHNFIGHINDRMSFARDIFKMKQEKGIPDENLETNEIVFPNYELYVHDFPNFVHSSENLAYSISNVTISEGPVTLSAGQMLLLLRKIGGQSANTITGSIQKYGSTISLVCWMGARKIDAWEVKREFPKLYPATGDDYDIPEKSNSVDIPGMARELAFKIAKDISTTEIEAKTWSGLKSYTDALDEYNQYNQDDDEERLELSWNFCKKAANAERRYIEPYKLLFNLGKKYYNIGKYIKSKQVLQDSIDIKQEAKSFFGLGIACTYLQEYDEAVRAYDDAINAYDKADLKDKADACNNKGNVLNRIGDNLRSDNPEEATKTFEEAIKACDEAIGLYPKYSPFPWNNKGYALNRIGDILKERKKKDEEATKTYQEAIKVFDEIIKFEPDLARPWNNKGYALSGQGKYDEAIKAFDEATNLNKNYAAAWYNKGLALKALGRVAEGEAAIAKSGIIQKAECVIH